MSTQNIRWRLAPEGGDKVVSEARRAEQAIVQGQTNVAGATDKAIAASDRQIAKLREAAQAAAATTDVQRRIEALAGGDSRNLSLADQYSAPGNANARVSARVFQLGDEAYERRARELKNTLDPLGAAQDKLNDELREYQALANAGKISTEQLAQAQVMARQRFDESAAAIQRQGRGLTRLQAASRLNLARQIPDVAVTAAMGMNPAMIALQQGPQILDAMATSGFKANAALIAAGAGLSVVAAGVVLMAAAWAKGESAAADYVDITTGVGRTAGLTASQLRDLTVAAAESGDISRSAARTMAAEYLATGQIGKEVLGGLISLTKDYASFMGVDAEQATKGLARAMMDPKAAAHEMTLQFGLLNQEQLTNIDNLVAQGDLMGAQKALFEELDRAMRGHTDRAEEITDAWNAIGRSISDAIDKLGEFLLTTDDERLPKLQRQLENILEMERRGNPNQGRRRDIERQIRVEETRRSMVALAEDGAAAEAAANQKAERDRQAAERREREGRAAARRAQAEASRAQREAERAAREAQQQRRREEDRQAQLDMEVARATNDIPRIRELEREANIRARVRELTDGAMSAELARTKAMEEQGRLDDARTEQDAREIRDLGVMRDIEIMRLAGEARFVASRERALDVEARVLRLVQLDLDVETARNQVASEEKDLNDARALSAERTASAREREWRIQLAMARGDTEALKRLNGEDWIQRRAREIEGDRDNPLNHGEGEKQAAKEYGELMRAETSGAMREGVKGLASDIRRSGLDDALGEQFDRAGDRLISKLIDGLWGMDWGSLFSGRGGGGGNWISKGLGFLFGRNARGTNFWDGGLTWVGEEGPELADLPRGTRIRDHASSMRMMRETAGAAQRVLVEVRAVKGDAFEPEVVRISGAVVQQGMATAYGQSVDTSMKAAPTAVADARAYKG